MVSLDDEEHAVVEILGQISSGCERGSDVAGGADNEDRFGACPSHRWRIWRSGPHATYVGFFDLEGAEVRSDSEQLIDHPLGASWVGLAHRDMRSRSSFR